MIITATQIKINGVMGFFRFFPRVGRVKKQLKRVDGLVFLKFNGLSTLSGWESLEAMKAFRNSEHHLEAMKNIKHIGKTKSVTWEAEYEPDWAEAKEKLREIDF